ncbi:MAG TPA: hypothetical protein VMZ52_14180 [Bryobacteraceae bacterium]|nr:hypothetical protein [Bryobacteraceae bacterium]
MISGIKVDDIGHSSFRVTWNSDVQPDNQRVDWGPTTSLGKTLYTYNPYYGASTQQLIVSGLQIGVDTDGSRNLYFCPRSHNGNGWSACTPQKITLLPVPFIHPAPPALPQGMANFPISEPSTADCTSQPVASDLSDLQEKINSAVSNQISSCQVINIPADAAGSPYIRVPPPADADAVSAIDAGTHVLTLGTSNSTYTKGDRVRISGDFYSGVRLPPGVSESADYCVSNAAGMTLQLTDWPACSSVVPVGPGKVYIMPFPPRNTNFITLQGNVPLPPENVRVDEAWRTHAPAWGVSCTGMNNEVCGSIMFGAFSHHWYIKGIDFRSGAGDATTTDPAPWTTHITMRPSNSYIAFDRVWVTGAGRPAREYVPIYWEGSAVQIRASAITKMDYWRPSRSGLTQTTAGAALTIAGGTYNTGLRNCPSISPATATLTQSTSGTAYVSVRPADCAVVVTLPAGAAATCSNCTTATGSEWPSNEAGNPLNARVASCAFTAGSWAGCNNYDDVNFGLSGHYFDAVQNIVSCGPGPMLVENIYHEGSGILWHFDDTGSNVTYGLCHVNAGQPPADITFRRNRLETPARLMSGSPGSDGFNYRNRHNWECKRCARVLLKGNEFSGSFRDVANDGASLMINGNASYSLAPTPSYAGDVTIESNWIHDANGGIMTSGGPPNSGATVPQLGRRFRVVNNFLSNISGYKWHSALGSPGNGFCFQIGHGGEDVVYDHNTCYSAAGQLPSVLQIISKMVEGFQFTNNAAYVHADGGRQGLVIDWGSFGGNPACGGLLGTAGLKCFTNGASTFLNNLLISGYTDSRNMSGHSDGSAFAAAWSGSGSYLPTQSTVPARIASVKWKAPATLNLRLEDDSPYRPGGTFRATDNLDIGMNQDALENALGWANNVRVLSLTASSASIAFHAPDPGAACYVGYGASPDPTTWPRTEADSSATQERSISVTGLDPGTVYSFQVWCSGTAPTSTQTVTTPSAPEETAPEARAALGLQVPVTSAQAPGSDQPMVPTVKRSGDVSGWYGAWTTRRRITFTGPDIPQSEEPADVPILVSLSDPELKSLPDGSDILFTAGDGISKIPYEIESYDAESGTLAVWIRLRSRSRIAETSVFLYYGRRNPEDLAEPAEGFQISVLPPLFYSVGPSEKR